MIRAGVLLAILITSVSAGELAITHGMKRVGGPAHLRVPDVLAFLWRALRNGWFWTGVPLMAVSFYALLTLLSWEPLSFVIPASALTYVSGTLGAKYLLGEEVSGIRWAGVLLVCAGVVLVTLG